MRGKERRREEKRERKREKFLKLEMNPKKKKKEISFFKIYHLVDYRLLVLIRNEQKKNLGKAISRVAKRKMPQKNFPSKQQTFLNFTRVNTSKVGSIT